MIYHVILSQVKKDLIQGVRDDLGEGRGIRTPQSPQGFQTKPYQSPGPEINHPQKPHVVPVIST